MPNNETPKTPDYKVNEKTLNTVLGYLSTRPYQEVATIVKAVVEGAQKIEEENRDTNETDLSETIKAAN